MSVLVLSSYNFDLNSLFSYKRVFILVSNSESEGRFYVLKLSKNLSAVLYKFLFKTYVNFSAANYLWINLNDDG